MSVNHSRAGSIFSAGGIGSSSAIGSVQRGRTLYNRILSTPLRSPGIGPSVPRGKQGARISPSPNPAYYSLPGLSSSVIVCGRLPCT